MKSVAVIVVVALTFFSSGCGTGVGNALHSGTDFSSAHSDLSTVQIMNAMCSKIISCHGGPNNCSAEIQQVQTIDTEIGLTADAYINYNAVIAADFSKDILANTKATNDCVTDLDNLACDDTAVQNAYQPGDAQPFAQVADILPVSCQGVF